MDPREEKALPTGLLSRQDTIILVIVGYTDSKIGTLNSLAMMALTQFDLQELSDALGRLARFGLLDYIDEPPLVSITAKGRVTVSLAMEGDFDPEVFDLESVARETTDQTKGRDEATSRKS